MEMKPLLVHSKCSYNQTLINITKLPRFLKKFVIIVQGAVK